MARTRLRSSVVFVLALAGCSRGPEPTDTGPRVELDTDSVAGVRVEVEHRPGSERYERKVEPSEIVVFRGGDRFEFHHGIPLVNGITFPSPAVGDTLRWNLSGPLFVNGQPVEPHRFQPRPLDAPPTELKWDIKNPSDAPRDSLSADWSRVGHVLVTAHGDGVVRVWDVEKKTVRTEITPPAPTDGRKRWGFKAAVSPDGKTVAAANVQTASVTIWEADTGNLRTSFHESIGNITQLRFVSDAVLHVVCSGVLSARDLTRDPRVDSKVEKLIGSAEPPLRVSFPPTPAGVTADVDDDGRLTLWDGTKRSLRPLWWRSAGRTVPVTTMAFFADGKTLAVGAADGLRLYDVETGRERGWVQTLSIRSLAVSGDGAFLAASMEHGPAVLLWRTADLQPR
ncbi:MAG TPA: hypothetical protein VD866_13680 [Urbifossiella sp.]|nr:hypothetical protein [Urbifossiella sp.]